MATSLPDNSAVTTGHRSGPDALRAMALLLGLGAASSSACLLTSDFDGLTDEPPSSSASTGPSSSGSGAGGAASSSSGGGAGDGGSGGAGGRAETCGDRRLQRPEACDDGNEVDGDGCSASCAIECDEGSPHTHLHRASGHCYRFSPVELSWMAAASDCATWNGHLVTVTSAIEEQFLQDLLTSEGGAGAWLGATDAATEGVFVWANGEPWGFESWAPNAPDDPNGNKDCVFHGPPGVFAWNDYGCAGLNTYVCERSPGLD
ncbi:MAG: lectin-like protein [Polyangiaceae bacterium]